MFSNLPIDWTHFAIAALVLVFPLPLLFGKGVQHRDLDRSWHNYVSKVFALWWHWLDLIRVVAGTRLLMAAVGFSHDPRAVALPKGIYVVVAAVLLIAVIVQTVACKAPHGFNAACVIVFGVTATLYPPLLAGLTLVSALTVALALRSLPAFFFAVPACLVGVGALLLPKWIVLGMWAPVAVVPAILPLLFQREIVLAHRAVVVEPEPDHR